MKKTYLAILLFVFAFFSAAGFAQTILLSPERAGHTATRLPSGMVLITGGVNESATLDSALLYNPATNKFSPTGNMTTPRSYHTATLLYNGTVLLTGGDPGGSLPLLKSAEVYNPATGKFALVSHGMSIGRDKHTATLLHDGRVLIVGGKQSDIYDPVAQSFSVTATSPTNRSSHAAVLLENNTVLVTGGYVGSLPSSDAWIFNPATSGFTMLSAMMRIPRANHAMTLMLSGKVLVTGGFTGTSPHDEVDIYDPAAQTFTSARHMIFHRSNHEALLLPDGKVLVVGGTTLESGFLETNEIYDPVQATWTVDDVMQENRSGATANLLLNGNVLVTGGITGSKTLKSAEILDPVTHAFTPISDMKVPRNQHSATLLNDGRVLLAAGSTDFVFLKSAEIFNPTNNSFTLTGSLVDDPGPPVVSGARKSHTETLLPNGMVLLTGGKSDSGDLDSAELYDPVAGTFSQTNPMNDGRSLHTATLLNSGEVLIAGGRKGATPIQTAELFDSATESFTFTGSLNIQRKRHAATLLNDGTVLVEGGASIPNGMAVDAGTPTAEVYHPVTGAWTINTPAGDMSTGRTEHAATLLPDDTVLVTGGISTIMPSDLYHPATQTFSTVDGLLHPRQRHIAILLDSHWGSLEGQVLEIGGASTGNSVFGGLEQALDTVEIYNPATTTFSLFGTMTEPRQNNTATLLKNGKILIAGGVSSPAISATGEIVPENAGTPTPTPTISPTPTITPTPTPTPPGNLLNISTRLKAQTGENVLIGGFIIIGTEPKNVLIRAIGPSLKNAVPPVAGALADPILELHKPDGTVVTNDDWKSDQQPEIKATGAPPTSNLESAIVASLAPVDATVPGSGQYTAIVRGKDGGTGVALVEVYDLDFANPQPTAQLANTSTRGLVETVDNVMIGGFIVGPAPATGAKVLVRAIGPSLSKDVATPLPDPNLEIHDGDGNIIAVNDNWASSNADAIRATGLAPTNALESAVLLSDLAAGSYTGIVRGKNETTGVALVEVYRLQ